MKKIITPLVLAFCLNAQAQYLITTAVGTGVAGFSGDGGQASAARLQSAAGVAIDAQGNLYVADQTNQRIRKVTASTGVISTLAGIGIIGYSGDGGAATSAQLYSPANVATDTQGNVYVAEWGSQSRIRKIDVSTGTITTVAGNGTYGYSGDGGAAISAAFASVNGVTTDAANNIYISDSENKRIRKVDAGSGIITTVAGNGTSAFSGDGGQATLAALSYPSGIAIDTQGNLYIADRNNHRIRKVNANGIITTIAGNGIAGFSGDGGAATASKLNYPSGIAVDTQGYVYIADKDNHRIRMVNQSTGIITTLAGNGYTTTNQYSQVVGGYSGDIVESTTAALNFPTGVAINAQSEIYIADNNNFRIRKLTPCTGTFITVSASQYTICSGKTISLSASGANSYTWNTGHTGSIVPYLIPLVNSTYAVAGTSSIGCSMANVSIVLNPTPTLSINNYTVCTGYSLAITPTLVPSGINFTLTTLSGTTNVLTISLEETSLIPYGNNPYTFPYTLVGKSPEGCASNNVVFLVTFNQSPKITVNNPEVCLNTSAVISPSGAATYTITGGNYTVNTSSIGVTNYTVSSISDAGCLGSAIATVSVIACVTTNTDTSTGVTENSIDNTSIIIYPNPVKEILNVELEISNEKQIEISVYNTLGAEVIHNSLFIIKNSATLDVHDLPNGIYFLRIGNEVKKLVKD